MQRFFIHIVQKIIRLCRISSDCVKDHYMYVREAHQLVHVRLYSPDNYCNYQITVNNTKNDHLSGGLSHGFPDELVLPLQAAHLAVPAPLVPFLPVLLAAALPALVLGTASSLHLPGWSLFPSRPSLQVSGWSLIYAGPSLYHSHLLHPEVRPSYVQSTLSSVCRNRICRICTINLLCTE